MVAFNHRIVVVHHDLNHHSKCSRRNHRESSCGRPWRGSMTSTGISQTAACQQQTVQHCHDGMCKCYSQLIFECETQFMFKSIYIHLHCLKSFRTSFWLRIPQVQHFFEFDHDTQTISIWPCFWAQVSVKTRWSRKSQGSHLSGMSEPSKDAIFVGWTHWVNFGSIYWGCGECTVNERARSTEMIAFSFQQFYIV